VNGYHGPEYSRLETPRYGRVMLVLGLAWFAVAGVGLLVFDLIKAPVLAPLSLIPMAGGLFIAWMGRQEVRRAARHHQWAAGVRSWWQQRRSDLS